jgi:hypothetical protein
MKTVNMTRGEYLQELVNLYKVRTGMSGDEARRYVMDATDDFLSGFDLDIPAQDAFQEDVNAWVN